MHRATARFWKCFERLPEDVKKAAKKSFDLLKTDPLHPSLHFKKSGDFWSVRVDLSHRALGIKDGQDFIWTWIGSHSDYDRMIQKKG